MKINRFILEDNIEPNTAIQDLEWNVDSDNNAVIKWSWPKNSLIKIALVFEISTATEDLAELLEKNISPVIITKGMDIYYKRPLEKDIKRFAIFPAYFGEGSNIVILNQKLDNVTESLYKKIQIWYNIIYKPIILSELQKVNIHIELQDQIDLRNIIVYEKYENSRLICIYPLDMTDMSFFIRKTEHVKIKPLKAYEAIVVLQEI